MRSPDLNTPRPTWAEIDLDNLSFNLSSVRRFIGDQIAVMAVIKANAYGHGAVECARRLEKDGVDWFGVARPEEGIALRSAGINTPILCLGGFWPGQEQLLLANDLAVVIPRLELAESLDRVAASLGTTAAVHVKIDTGMGRIGVRFDAVSKFVKGFKTFKNLRLCGLMTHFASADNPADDSFTELQVSRFYDAAAVFERGGVNPEVIDLANSPGAIAHPNSRGNLVRLGGVLYGLGGDVLPAGVPKPDLRPVLSLYSRVSHLKRVPEGESLGYGRTYFTGSDSIVATIPIGYADGYRRALSNRAEVSIRGRSAPVVGRISMDWTIIDVTHIPDVAIGDPVVLIGADGEISIKAEDLGSLLDTISYEITCGISERVPRIYNHGA